MDKFMSENARIQAERNLMFKKHLKKQAADCPSACPVEGGCQSKKD